MENIKVKDSKNAEQNVNRVCYTCYCWNYPKYSEFFKSGDIHRYHGHEKEYNLWWVFPKSVCEKCGKSLQGKALTPPK